MIRTRVGYSGGTKKDPTYRDLGDHTETIEIDFDPQRITFEDLLDIYWDSHSPTSRAWSLQYASFVFFHDEEQKKVAVASRDRLQESLSKKIRTGIVEAKRFYRAEDYHQKHRLRNMPGLLEELSALYPDAKDFTDSTAVTRVNGYLGGYGTRRQLEEEVPKLGLSQDAQRVLLKLRR